MELKASARRVRSVTMTEYTRQRTRTIARSAATINNTRVIVEYTMRRARAVSSTHYADGGVCDGMGRRRVAVDPAAVGATVVAVPSADDDYAAAAVAVGGDAAVSVVATRRRHRRW